MNRCIFMSGYKFSQKLTKYLNKIEIETGRKIKFLERSDLGIKGTTAAYRYHPQYILIIINPENHRSKDDIERSVAHEATHGYILHKLGFCRAEFHENMDDKYKMDVQLVFTMIEDIVVNKIIQNNGFPPFGHEYLPMVNKEIEIAHEGEEKGEIFYHKFTDDPHLEALLMISRYIIAWGFLRYYKLQLSDAEIINKFTSAFKRFYPDYYQFAAKIEEIIEKKDIFKGNDECKAILEILQFFKLSEGVELVRD